MYSCHRGIVAASHYVSALVQHIDIYDTHLEQRDTCSLTFSNELEEGVHRGDMQDGTGNGTLLSRSLVPSVCDGGCSVARL